MTDQPETAPCPFHEMMERFNPLEETDAVRLAAFYTRAHEEAPVFYSPKLDAYVISRHADVLSALKDHERISRTGSQPRRRKYVAEALAVLEQGVPMLANALIFVDPPLHTRLRKVVADAVTPRRMASLAPVVRATAHRMVDSVIAKGGAEFMSWFAFPFPVAVVSELLSFPAEDHPKIRVWVDDFMRWSSSPNLDAEEQVACARSVVALQRYLMSTLEERKASPKDDLVGDLLRSVDAGPAGMSMEEVLDNVALLIIGGYHTTALALGNGIYRLLSERARWEALCAEPALAPTTVEEILRYDGIGEGIPREAKEDVEIGGVLIEKGSKLHIANIGAHFDKEVFPNPTEFDMRRENASRHTTFGYGIHYCVGAPLARLEMRIALEVLAERLPGLRLGPEEEQKRVEDTLHLAFSHLPVAWDV